MRHLLPDVERMGLVVKHRPVSPVDHLMEPIRLLPHRLRVPEACTKLLLYYVEVLV